MEKRQNTYHHIAKGLVFAAFFWTSVAFAELKHKLDDIMRALVTVESSCNPKAINPADGVAVKITSYGLGQLTLATAEHICDLHHVEDLMNGVKNLRCTKKLVTLLGYMYQTDEDVIAAYNTGTPCVCDGQRFRYVDNNKICGKSCKYKGTYRNFEYISKVLNVLEQKSFCY